MIRVTDPEASLRDPQDGIGNTSQYTSAYCNEKFE
jgi:hypothetical protein